MFKKIFLLFFLWRTFLFVPILIANKFIPYRNGYDYTSPVHFLDKSNNIISNFLLSPWANFDGVYYLLIAAKGYTVNAGFFPLFPLSISIINFIFNPAADRLPFEPLQYFTAVVLVSLYFVLSLIVMFKLIKIDYKQDIAIWSIIFMLLFPTSFFYATIYSESLFLLLSLCSFYFALKKRWILAAFFGTLLTATRMVGIAIIPALIYEFIKEEKSLFKIKSIPLFFMPLGILSYMLFNFIKWGNAFYFIWAQGNFQNNRSVTSLVFIPQTMYRYIKILLAVKPVQFEWWVAILEISIFIFTSILLFIAWKKKIRISYLIFSLICFLIPVSSGTFTGLPRYSLTLFPIFIALALVKNKTVKIFYAIIGFTLLFILFMLFSKGYFIA